MSFTGNENHEISFEDGAALTKKYHDEAPSGALKALFFGKDAIQQLLDQDGSVGIRIYFGWDEDKNNFTRIRSN